MKPAVSRVRSEGFKIVLVDVSQQQEQAIASGVRRIPTCIYRRDGEEVFRVRGRVSANRLRSMCRGFRL